MSRVLGCWRILTPLLTVLLLAVCPPHHLLPCPPPTQMETPWLNFT